MTKFDLAIIGAGIAGRSLATIASEAGLSCCLIESAPLDGFSSVNNQGWLHSGALYAARDGAHASEVADACKLGALALSQFDRQHDLNAIGSSGCVFVYDDGSELEREFELIRAQGIWAEKMDRDRLIAEETIVGTQTDYVGGIETTDTTVNTAAILNKLLDVACAHGCQTLLLTTRQINQIKASRVAGGWRLEGGHADVEAQIVICAAGAMLPDAVGKMVGTELSETSVNKCLVMAINAAICSRMLISRTHRNRQTNVAPYFGGVTVNMGARDLPAKNWTDGEIGDEVVLEMRNHLFDYLPLLREKSDISVAVYVCQKLNIGYHRHYHWQECDKDFFIYYPGKFTQALYSARTILDELFRKYSFARTVLDPVACSFPSVTHPGTRIRTHVLTGGDFRAV